jgi:hypothetical protein
VHLVFDIFQGIGVAAALGIRPFLPGLVAGALAAGDVEIHFNGTHYGFLQSPGFLLALALGAIALTLLERRLKPESFQKGGVSWALALISVSLGALFFAGSLCRGGYTVWPGYPAGVVCAAVGLAGSRPFLARVRARLDEAAVAIGPPLVAETAAVVIAALSIVAPPVGPIALALLLWLAISGRGRGDDKFAGLRILR